MVDSYQWTAVAEAENICSNKAMFHCETLPLHLILPFTLTLYCTALCVISHQQQWIQANNVILSHFFVRQRTFPPLVNSCKCS